LARLARWTNSINQFQTVQNECSIALRKGDFENAYPTQTSTWVSVIMLAARTHCRR